MSPPKCPSIRTARGGAKPTVRVAGWGTSIFTEQFFDGRLDGRLAHRPANNDLADDAVAVNKEGCWQRAQQVGSADLTGTIQGDGEGEGELTQEHGCARLAVLAGG